MKVYISLTTLPYRIKYIKQVLDSIMKQTFLPDKIFLNIPLKYKRFPEETISELEINALQEKYKTFLQINRVTMDYGPGTKLVGTLPYINFNSDGILILIDDDVSYNNYVIENIVKQYQCDLSNKNKINCYSYCAYDIDIDQNKFPNLLRHRKDPKSKPILTIGQGVDCFAIPFVCLYNIEKYVSALNFENIVNDDIRIFLFLHDDLWISYYLYLMKYDILNIKSEKSAYNYLDDLKLSEDHNALYNLKGIFSRSNCVEYGLFTIEKLLSSL